MIPKWREVRYTDDGCSIFQCLSCYGQWESRSEPSYSHDGEYKAIWRFCPLCGCQWDGSAREGDHFGLRRQRIIDAIRSPEPSSTPDFWWVVEERWIWGQDEHPWKPIHKIRAGTLVAKVLALKRQVEASKGDPDGPGLPITYEYRLMKYLAGDTRLDRIYETHLR